MIDVKWLFSWKYDDLGRVVKTKSRISHAWIQAARTHKFWKDVCPHRFEFLGALWSAITWELNLDVCHFDVEQAFVHSKLEEDVFLRLPKGCRNLSGTIVRLNKSLYGLKQAFRSWLAHLTSYLKTLDFQHNSV